MEILGDILRTVQGQNEDSDNEIQVYLDLLSNFHIKTASSK